MLQPGDHYVHFTKYGGKNFGRIISINTIYAINLLTFEESNRFQYEIPVLMNEKNISYKLDGTDGQFFKINKNEKEKEI